MRCWLAAGGAIALLAAGAAAARADVAAIGAVSVMGSRSAATAEGWATRPDLVAGDGWPAGTGAARA